jgi:hypothetical protein
MNSVASNVSPDTAGGYELVKTSAPDVHGPVDVEAQIRSSNEVHGTDHSIQWKNISWEVDVKSLTGKVLSTKKILSGVSGEVKAGEVGLAARHWTLIRTNIHSFICGRYAVLWAPADVVRRLYWTCWRLVSGEEE